MTTTMVQSSVAPICQPHQSTSRSKPLEPRRDSKFSSSLSTPSTSQFSIPSTQSHQAYLDSLPLPTMEDRQHIAAVQESKEQATIAKNLQAEQPGMGSEERAQAAAMIQKNYRGYRERRQLKGMGLDPESRWMEAIKEARYRNLTQPRPRSNDADGVSPDAAGVEHTSQDTPGPRKMSAAKNNWKKIGTIARRAGGDEDADSSSHSSSESALPEDEREAKKRKKVEERAARHKAAKMMDLQYFLEMVDLKHRYGSNLRTYHEEWKKADTQENFFYWLDYGEGRLIDCAGCPRERLDKEQVRYLSKEERLDYLVRIDKEGRLCWAKNGERIDTTENYKDSIHGVVPSDDPTPAYAPPGAEAAVGLQEEEARPSSASSTASSHSHTTTSSDGAAARADKYVNPELSNAPPIKKVAHVSAATIFNKLLRSSVKKNTWIFVADTSFRLYVGIKQSGAFQHSSFLHGSRISAAGLVKIKNGRLSKLSPLSGHYRPPVSNFRAFVHSLKDAGADMSHVSISRSYAVLVGLEAYVKTRRKGKELVKNILHHRDKVLNPEETRKRDEEAEDKSQSAKRERETLQKIQQEENRVNGRLLERLSMG